MLRQRKVGDSAAATAPLETSPRGAAKARVGTPLGKEKKASARAETSLREAEAPDEAGLDPDECGDLEECLAAATPKRIVLSERDAKLVLNLMKNPPPPTPALLEAARLHVEWKRREEKEQEADGTA